MDAAMDRGAAAGRLHMHAMQNAGASVSALQSHAAANCEAGAMVVGESRRRVRCPAEFKPGTLIGRYDQMFLSL